MPPNPRPPPWLAAVPLAGLAWAAVDHAAAGTLPALLWSCDAAALALAVGLASGVPRALWVGEVVLVAAAPAWLVSVATGGETGWHGVVVHVLAPVAGAVAIRRTACPADVVPVAFVGLAALTALSRAVTPPALDVNAAHQAPATLAALGLAALAALAVAHAGLRRLAPAPDALADAIGPHPERFRAHLARKAARGPGDKAALKALLARWR